MITLLRAVLWLLVGVQMTNVLWYANTAHPYPALTIFNVVALLLVTRNAVRSEIDA